MDVEKLAVNNILLVNLISIFVTTRKIGAITGLKSSYKYIWRHKKQKIFFLSIPNLPGTE